MIPASAFPLDTLESERPGRATVSTMLDTYSHAIAAMWDEAAERIDVGLRIAMEG